MYHFNQARDNHIKEQLRRDGNPDPTEADVFKYKWQRSSVTGISITHRNWDVTEKTLTARNHGAIQVTVADETTRRQFWLDAGGRFKRQGNLGGSNHIFFEGDWKGKLQE